MLVSDGERQAPKKLEETEPSHLIRYEFAKKFIGQQDNILDAPCGSGYGTFSLSENSSRVYGIDIHAGAINHARENFSSPHNSFYTANIEDMQEIFPNESIFDIVVSFEGIEHLQNPLLFLNEAKRLLKKNGKMIISTPKPPHGSPYHINEYSLEEFKEILSNNFDILDMYGQIFTDIFNMKSNFANPHDYKRFNYIAICSQK